MKEGAKVNIDGLSPGGTHAQYNGTQALVKGFDEQYNRWNVIFDLDGESALLRESNLTVIPVVDMTSNTSLVAGCKVTFSGLTNEKHSKYNGTTGKCLAWNEDLKRWKVSFDESAGEEAAYIKAQNLSRVIEPKLQKEASASSSSEGIELSADQPVLHVQKASEKRKAFEDEQNNAHYNKHGKLISHKTADNLAKSAAAADIEGGAPHKVAMTKAEADAV